MTSPTPPPSHGTPSPIPAAWPRWPNENPVWYVLYLSYVRRHKVWLKKIFDIDSVIEISWYLMIFDLLVIRSRLIWIYHVCKCVSEFTWCPNLPDFTLTGHCRSSPKRHSTGGGTKGYLMYSGEPRSYSCYICYYLKSFAVISVSFHFICLLFFLFSQY